MNFSVENIWKKYGKNTVLKSFSYTFESGLYLLTGINGIGKSTLLKIIAKVINPTNSNYNIKSDKVAYLCEKTELSSDKVLVYLKTISKLNNKKIDLKKTIDKWNIPNKNISNLSKGNKQKVAILMMALTNANIYLFDEPTDALDIRGKELFCELIKEFIDLKKIVIICTHEKEYFKNISYKELNLK